MQKLLTEIGVSKRISVVNKWHWDILIGFKGYLIQLDFAVNTQLT